MKVEREYVKTCSGCGIEFTTTNHRINFCQRPHPYTCQNCGVEFTTDGPFRKTCSPRCRSELISKSSKETWSDPSLRQRHSEIMKDDRLQKRRKEKYLETVKERYGDKVVNTGQLKSTREKIEETNRKRYGANTPLKNKEVQDKIKKTNMLKYGVSNAGGIESSLAKIKETNLARYGVEWTSQLDTHRSRNRKVRLNRQMSNEEDWVNFSQFVNDNPDMNLYEMSEYFNIRYQSVRSRIVKFNLMNKVKNFYSFSQAENVFKSFIDSLGLIEGIDYLPHYRREMNGEEIDFFFPNYRFGVEISPTFYHNNNYLNDKDYHYNKYSLCEELGIELYTIFEWHDLKKVNEMIQTKLGRTQSFRVGANKCKTLLLKKAEKIDHKFLDENHVLGDVKLYNQAGIVRLIYNDEILGLGVFTKTKNKDEVELKRLVFKMGVHIPGGASKIIKNFLKVNKYTKLMTFSDNDLGSGNVYLQLGMKLVEHNRGQLNWFNIKYQKKVRDLSLVMQGADRLLASFPGYSPIGNKGENLPTNHEILESYGFLPVYDCGYKKWQTNSEDNPKLFR